ncbi:hypothetical protein ABID25_003509 [Mesorhizobium abyssinicae]
MYINDHSIKVGKRPVQVTQTPHCTGLDGYRSKPRAREWNLETD